MDLISIEKDMLKLWKEKGIYALAKEKNKKGKDFYFLDGPPYTSGKVHIGTAWNKSLKDMVLRYKRMKGFNVWDRAGYDMHGLPTAHKVEAKFGIKNKDEIPKFGIAKFVEECKKLSLGNLDLMNKDFERMGIWMDFEHAYKSVDNSFIEGEWWLVKKAHENKRLYEGERVMHWCAHCATALAKHELEYQTVSDDSVYLKFRVKGAKDEYLIIWTTTPWTIPYNLAVMVNPELDYVKCKVGNEKWILVKALAAPIIANHTDSKYEVLEEFKGEKLKGLQYVHPLYEDLKDVYDKLKEKSPKLHSVVLSKEYVDVSAGSGLVHCAPGCGPEDYEVGYQNKILPFNNLDEQGMFPKEMGKYSGLTAKKDDKKFIDIFEEKGALIKKVPVDHEYAHCWRCHNPVVFRTTKQWFFKIEDLKQKMRELNQKIDWQPDWAGSRQFDSWLDNLRDNSITRQRYWGCPVPIWKCDKCGKYEVIGSVKELEEKSNMKAPEDLHIPHIDSIIIPCKCTGTMHRVEDILDVWVDAGTTSWTCLNYPQDEELFKKLWPADFILEGKDQIRGWFNLLLVASMVSMGKPSYKSVYMHGFVNDAQGRKMSKSLGNYILPEEVIDKYGADTLRYYAVGGANPGLDLNYNFDDMKIKYRNLLVFWNLHKLLIDIAKDIRGKPKKPNANDVAEKYILSKLNSTITEASSLFEEYRLDEVPLAVEELFLELSRTYIQLVRDKSSVGSVGDKQDVLNTMYEVYFNALKMFAPIAPLTTEAIYQNLKEAFKLKEESIHLYDWPLSDKKMVDKELEESVEIMKFINQAILSSRDRMKQGIRWPLKEAVIVSSDKKVEKAVNELGNLIMTITNVKSLRFQATELKGVKTLVKPDYSKLNPAFGAMAPKIIAKLALDSTETILSHIEKDGKYVMKIDGADLEILPEHLMKEKKVPEGFEAAEFRNGAVYIDKEMNSSLEAEGYARELMRKVQVLRKKAGLEKADRIALFVKADEDLVESLNKFSSQIKEKVGADQLKISDKEPVKKHPNNSKEKIKMYSFDIWFSKI